MPPAEEPVLQVRPERIQLGETLIIEGPPYQVLTPRTPTVAEGAVLRGRPERTEVVLQGIFTDPSGVEQYRKLVLAGSPLPVPADPQWAERVQVRFGAAERHLIGPARFKGRVAVVQKVKGEEPVTLWAGTEQSPVRIHFFPPTMRSLARRLVDRLSDDRMLVWLGLDVEATPRGLRVLATTSDRPGWGNRASAAGIEMGDLLLSADGAPLRGAGGLTGVFRRAHPRSQVTLAGRRGGREVTARIAARGRPFILPTSVIYVCTMLVFGLLVLGLAMVIAGVLTWVERRVAGRMQFRIGPNRVGPQGVLQWVADGIKLVLKEDIIPDDVDRPLFRLAPYLVFMGLLGTFVVIPFGQLLIVADLNVGLVYLIAITSFVSLGLMMAGWSANNKWALLGGMRSAAQIVSYEIPAGLSLMVPVILAGTLSTQSLVEGQGPWPWQWYAFDNPFVFVCFVIYFISALAEGNRTPFDLPEAESELVAGYNIEYSGWRFAVFFLSEWANLFVIGAIATTVFLGGWQIPGVDVVQHASHWGWQLLGLCIFFAKAMTLVFVIIWVRWTLPRFRVDQMMGLCWKVFVPWTFVALVVNALWIWLAPPVLRTVVQWITFCVCGLGLFGLFVTRVGRNMRTNPEKRFSWNPFY